MASLTIRNLPDEVKTRLKVQAAHEGRSLEAHARQILQQAADGSDAHTDIVKTFESYFGQENGIDLDPPARKSARAIPEFD